MLCCSRLKIDRTGRHLVMIVFWVKVDRHSSWCCDWQDGNLEYLYIQICAETALTGGALHHGITTIPA